MNIFEPNYAAAAELGLSNAGGVEDQLLSEEEKRRKRMQQQPVHDPFGNRVGGKDQSRVTPGMPAAWNMLGLR